MPHAKVGALEISAYLVARPFINNFPPHGVSNVGHSVASGNESTPHAMNSFTEDNLYTVDAFTQYDDV